MCKHFCWKSWCTRSSSFDQPITIKGTCSIRLDFLYDISYRWYLMYIRDPNTIMWNEFDKFEKINTVPFNINWDTCYMFLYYDADTLEWNIISKPKTSYLMNTKYFSCPNATIYSYLNRFHANYLHQLICVCIHFTLDSTSNTIISSYSSSYIWKQTMYLSSCFEIITDAPKGDRNFCSTVYKCLCIEMLNY